MASSSLLSTKTLSKAKVYEIFAQTDFLLEKNLDSIPELKSNTVATLFSEESTRTKSSFQLAARQLGLNVLDLDLKNSSLKKGESLLDTVKTLISLQVKLLIIREKFSGAASSLASLLSKENLELKLINAGDGQNEHPSQALLDLYTLYRQNNKKIKAKQVLIVGDCKHSRVVRSHLYLLKLFGFQVTLVGPPNFLSEKFLELGVESLFYDLRKALDTKPDLIMLLRIQKERQRQTTTQTPSQTNSDLEEYAKYFCLTKKLLLEKKFDLEKIRILHPGPVNRNIELSAELVESSCSLINSQVKNGLYLRMAILKLLLENRL